MQFKLLLDLDMVADFSLVLLKHLIVVIVAVTFVILRAAIYVIVVHHPEQTSGVAV